MAVATESQNSGKRLNYEEFVNHQLRLTQSKIRSTELLTALVVMATILTGLLLVEILLDHWVGLPAVVRAAILAVTGIGAAYAGIRFVVAPLASRVSAFYAARRIETFDPRFKNSLLNYLDIRRHRLELSPAVLRTLEARAVADLAAVSVESAVDQRRLTQSFYALAAVVVAFCLYVLITPKNVLDSAKRALLADVARPTNTRLINIKPGDDPEASRVVSGDDVTITAEVDTRGIRPEVIELHYSEDGGEFFNVATLEEGERRYDPWAATLLDRERDLVYFLKANDFRSKRYKLTVLPAPRVVAVEHDVAYPAYTGVAPRNGLEGGNVRALEGSIVTVRGRTNQPAQTGFLDLKPAGRSRLTISTSEPREVMGRFKVTGNGTYTIKFTTVAGKKNPEPVVFDVESIPDLPPEAAFNTPVNDPTQVPQNARIELGLDASDDFGLGSARLTVMKGNQAIIDGRDLLEGLEPSRNLEHREPIDLQAIGVQAGDELVYWAEVADRRDPSPQRIETPKRRLKIVAPRQADEPRAGSNEPSPSSDDQTNSAPEGSQGTQDQPADSTPEDAVPPSEPPSNDEQPANPRDREPAAEDQGDPDQPPLSPEEKLRRILDANRAVQPPQEPEPERDAEQPDEAEASEDSDQSAEPSPRNASESGSTENQQEPARDRNRSDAQNQAGEGSQSSAEPSAGSDDVSRAGGSSNPSDGGSTSPRSPSPNDPSRSSGSSPQSGSDEAGGEASSPSDSGTPPSDRADEQPSKPGNEQGGTSSDSSASRESGGRGAEPGKPRGERSEGGASGENSQRTGDSKPSDPNQSPSGDGSQPKPTDPRDGSAQPAGPQSDQSPRKPDDRQAPSGNSGQSSQGSGGQSSDDGGQQSDASAGGSGARPSATPDAVPNPRKPARDGETRESSPAGQPADRREDSTSETASPESGETPSGAKPGDPETSQPSGAQGGRSDGNARGGSSESNPQEPGSRDATKPSEATDPADSATNPGDQPNPAAESSEKPSDQGSRTGSAPKDDPSGGSQADSANRAGQPGDPSDQSSAPSGNTGAENNAATKPQPPEGPESGTSGTDGSSNEPENNDGQRTTPSESGPGDAGTQSPPSSEAGESSGNRAKAESGSKPDGSSSPNP